MPSLRTSLQAYHWAGFFLCSIQQFRSDRGPVSPGSLDSAPRNLPLLVNVDDPFRFGNERSIEMFDLLEMSYGIQ
ncbi:unnamed protein product [Toxocara canis]|uniref:Sulfatase domain-containing protein n=1 Tax=Toxocara canis TaxID=6265 RepID=A0A183USD6_TOXCA|nr:unnamed protein product [Toxocara canis]